MAQHLQINIDPDTLAMQVAQTALRTAQENQTRKAANVYIPSGDGTGVLIGDTAENGGISRYDPESETQSPLWEGISQEELDAKADEILEAAKEDTAAQITIVNTTITEAQQAIEANREGLEQEAYLRAEADKAARETTAAIKTDTDKLKGDYQGMATDVASVKQDMLDTVSRVESAQTTADSKNKRFVQPSQPTYDLLKPGDEWWQTSSKPLETYWLGEPNNSVSVLVDHSGEVEHIWTWNGTRWVDLMLAADSLFVRGTVSAGLVSADFFDGAVVKGGAYLTSNERIQLNNSGFFVEDAQGNPVVTINAANGDATFQSVNIIGAGLSTPAISGGTIEGADYKLTTGTGANKQIVARINSDGVTFGDHLSYAKNGAGQWVLSLAGAIQSGGEISSAVITAPTIQTSSAENTGLKFTTGGLVAFDANGNTTFTLDNTGGIMMAGALMSNSEIISSNIYTSQSADDRVSIDSHGLTVTRGGETVIAFLTDAPLDVGTSGLVTSAVLDESLLSVEGEVQATGERLDAEVGERRRYMRFDSVNGLTIGDMDDEAGYRMQLTDTRLEFRAGDTVAAYVSNEQLYISNAEVLSTLRIGAFAWLPRENGHMSLQYVGNGGA